MPVVILHHFNKNILGWDSNFSLYLFVLSRTLKFHPSFRNSQPIALHMPEFPALVERVQQN